MRIKIGLMVLLLLMVLSACKSSYPCNSRERRDECETVLGDGYNMEHFDEMHAICGARAGTRGSEITADIRTRCIQSYYPNVPMTVIEECYQGTSLPKFRLTIACIEDHR